MDIKQYRLLQSPISPEISLIGNLVLPSTMHHYSLCVEYMKQWLIDTIEKGYGKGFFPENSVYIDGKHMYDDFIRMNDYDKLKRSKPSLAIIPKIDHSYNKENSYMKAMGIDRYIRKGTAKRGFFNDFDNNLSLNLDMKAIQVNFDIVIRLSTRAKQIDLCEYLKLACKIGWTNGDYKDMDYHVPYDLMMRLAQDAGFKVTDNKVEQPMKFLRYLNSNSSVPFLYKVRGVNGKQEYFVRVKDTYIHTRYESIDPDDGEREGQISSNFNINMRFTCTFPCPHFYIYYSEYKNDIPHGIEAKDQRTNNIMASYALKMTQFPDLDEHGWNFAMSCDIDEKDHSKPLHIDLNWLFQSDSDYNEILMMIKHCKEMMISPDIFLNFKLYNMGDPIPCRIDWNKMELFTNTVLRGDINSLAIYVNYQYMNEQLVVMEKYYDERIK